MDCVVLLPGQAAVESYRKCAALQCGANAFGTTVTTPAAWLSELWDLWGDTRHIASSSQRFIALYTALERQKTLPISTGVAELGVYLIEGGLGTPQIDKALAGDVSLHSSDVPLVALVREYEHILSDAHMVDAGRAWGVLASCVCPGLPVRIEVKGFEAPAVFRHFCEQQGIELKEPKGETSIAQASQGIDVRFAFPSGRYAEPLLLVDLITELLKKHEGKILITARHPYDLYERIAEGLTRCGISCAFQDSRAFSQTDFGRAVACVRSMITSKRFPRAAATDYLLNPFSGASKNRAYNIDARMRANRLIERDECLALVADASASFEYFAELVSSPEASILTGYFEDCAYGMREAGEAYIAEQLSAISCLRSKAEDALKLGASADAYFALLDKSAVDISRYCGTDDPQVVIMSQQQAAMCTPASCSTVIMCDMTSADYPVRTRDDAASSLLKSLGIEAPSSPLESARRVFSAIESLPIHELIIERCLNNENAEPTYPAVVVDEFVDCYRKDPTNADEVDNRYSLPALFLETIAERGEETLYENASLLHDVQETSASVSLSSFEQISPRQHPLIMLPRVIAGGNILQEPCFSASQLESYLECPQKWFALRRLRLDDLDEGFGSLEMGNFSHDAFKRFYQAFQSEVGIKVTPDSLEQAQAIMRGVIDELVVEQPSQAPSSGRLVPVSHLEAQQVRELGERLVSYLAREAEMLPSFTPRYFEYEIPVVDYAGYKLIGSVDRIDVNDRGQAVIIDYKSSLSDEYNLLDSDGEMRWGKVQALIYAQAVQRRLGLQVVGALYVGYARNPQAAGAIASTLAPQEIPGLKAKTCVYASGSFSDLLDATEERVAEAIERMLAGEVEPCPSSEHVCTWCPVMSCSKRQG